MSRKPFKVFYVTGIHGSEICWRKFLNVGIEVEVGDIERKIRNRGYYPRTGRNSRHS